MTACEVDALFTAPADFKPPVKPEPATEYQVSDLPKIGPIRIEHIGEENMYFRILSDDTLGFVKLG